jgi:hypothetical protein
MAVCEFHGYYTEFLNSRITTELDDPVLGKQDLGRALSVVQNAAICQTLGNISPDEAQVIYNRVFDLYPQFKEDLKAELEKKHLG